MTPEERAEKICTGLKLPGISGLRSDIAAEIRAAVADGQQFYYDHITVNAIAQAKAEAYREVLKILEDLEREEGPGIVRWIAREIRAKANAEEKPASDRMNPMRQE